MSSHPRYVIDANVMIEAARRYYAFDIVPGFWKQLVKHGKLGEIVSIDKVKAEIERGKDELAEWVGDNVPSIFVTSNDAEIVTNYSTVMNWVNGQSQFTPAAIAQFAGGADGWLIALAMKLECELRGGCGKSDSSLRWI